MFKPLHDNVLLELITEKNVTAGGIIIPDSAREKPSQGRVIAIGTGSVINGMIRAISVKPGDIIMFAKWSSSASEIKIDGKDYVLIRETDILGILE